jgi:uncharacterized membrane protein YeaQ/YmgE (transglycosylase-associated protein family)
MGLLSWVIVGGLAGLLAQSLMGDGRSGCLMTVLMGVVGAFIGGFVMSLFGFGGVNGLSIWSIVVATVGAVLLLAVGRALRR